MLEGTDMQIKFTAWYDYAPAFTDDP
jgi:hypothetical protein